MKEVKKHFGAGRASGNIDFLFRGRVLELTCDSGAAEDSMITIPYNILSIGFGGGRADGAEEGSYPVPVRSRII